MDLGPTTPKNDHVPVFVPQNMTTPKVHATSPDHPSPPNIPPKPPSPQNHAQPSLLLPKKPPALIPGLVSSPRQATFPPMRTGGIGASHRHACGLELSLHDAEAPLQQRSALRELPEFVASRSMRAAHTSERREGASRVRSGFAPQKRDSRFDNGGGPNLRLVDWWFWWVGGLFGGCRPTLPQISLAFRLGCKSPKQIKGRFPSSS